MGPGFLEDIERRMDDLRRDLMGRQAEWTSPAPIEGAWPSVTPACDVRDTGSEYVVTLDVPGFEKKDVHVDVEENGVRIWASTSRERSERGGKEGTWLRRERSSRAYERRIRFPEEVSASGTRATYANGVLEVTLPKTSPEKRRSKSVEVE